MTSRWFKYAKRTLIGLALIAVTLLAVRAYDLQRGPPLEPWHTFVPHELSVAELDKTDWAGYLKAEERDLRYRCGPRSRRSSARTSASRSIAISTAARSIRAGSRKTGTGLTCSNRKEPRLGAVVFLHGLTDSPYSLRHIARRYRAHGFVSVAPRLPAHGTVPGALTDVDWEQWMAATRIAVREARRLAGPGKPLHIVGFSNGGALALKYALDALGDRALPRPDRLFLISPMIGITSFARFAGLAGLPAILPAFARAAWIVTLPEFNPFKYNSFPINGARQSHRLTRAIQERVARYAREGASVSCRPSSHSSR